MFNPTLAKESGNKTIKSSVVNNGRMAGIQAKSNNGGPQGNIFKEYAKKPTNLVLNKENLNCRS